MEYACEYCGETHEEAEMIGANFIPLDAFLPEELDLIVCRKHFKVIEDDAEFITKNGVFVLN